MANNTPRVLADQALWKHKLSRLSLDNLVFLIEEKGYEIIDYSRSDDSEATQALINSIGVAEIAKANHAFLYCNQNKKYIFVNEELPEVEKRYALAHELGHIYCGHITANVFLNGTFEQEHEANEFAHYLLHPSLKHILGAWTVEHKVLAAILLAVIILAIAAIPITAHLQTKIYHDNYYVTDGGEHYHREDCYYIQGRNAHRMTEEEFASGEYTPCKICFH